MKKFYNLGPADLGFDFLLVIIFVRRNNGVNMATRGCVSDQNRVRYFKILTFFSCSNCSNFFYSQP